jgi:hypothetical protein
MYYGLAWAVGVSAAVVVSQIIARRYEHALSEVEVAAHHLGLRKRINKFNMAFQFSFLFTCFIYGAYFVAMLNMPEPRNQALAGLSILLPVAVALWDPKSWAHGQVPTERHYRNVVVVLSAVWIVLCELHAFGTIDILGLIGMKA